MSKKPTNKLSEQTKQIKSLLNDFKKIRSKCTDLASQLKIQLPKDSLYANIERTTLIKLELLDLPGIVSLKNSLVKILGELFDQERELLYRKQKLEAQDRIENQKREARLRARKENIQKAKEAAIIARSQSMADIIPENSLDSFRTNRTADFRQSKSIQIPIYKSRTQTIEQKMDRISKYIASLKKNMKCNSDAAGSKKRIREYLLDQPTYLKAKTLLERYLMREQELQRLISLAVRDKLKEHFERQSKILQTEEYILIKVDKPKDKLQHSQIPSEKLSVQNIMRRQISTSLKKKSEKLQVRAIEKQAGFDFQQIKMEIGKKNQNQAQIFIRMNQVIEKGNERLIQIRQKRKQALQDDGLWDQL